MQRAKKLCVSLSFSLVAILITLILFELLLILFPKFSVNYNYPIGLFQREDPPRDFSLVPQFKGELVGPEFNVEISINSRGLRDYEHAFMNNNLRILALGDSYAFGHGVEQNETFLSIVEQKLGKEIIKAGVPAYAQDNELKYYKDEGINYSHDVVLLLFYKNDIGGNVGANDWRALSGVLIPEKRYSALPRWKLSLYSKLFRSQVARLIQKSWRVIRASFTSFGDSKNLLIEEQIYSKNLTKESDGWKETYNLLSEFKEVTSSKKLILVYIPAVEQIDHNVWENQYNFPSFDRDMPNQVLAGMAHDLNISYIDLTDEVRNYNLTGLYFEFDNHFNGNGHRLFGLLLSQELKKATHFE